VIKEDTVQRNALQVSGTEGALQGTGAGLSFLVAAGHTAPVTQSGNVFDSNTITALPPAGGDYGGAGEWLEYASLLSVGDRFSRNLVAGTTSPSGARWSWARGLGSTTRSRAVLRARRKHPREQRGSGNAIAPGNLGGGGVGVDCTICACSPRPSR